MKIATMAQYWRAVDWMCIGIEKVTETACYAEYEFVCNVYESDPEREGRSRMVGNNRGILKVLKQTGEILLVRAMPEDDGNERFKRAASKIRKQWELQQYPDKTLFACG